MAPPNVAEDKQPPRSRRGQKWFDEAGAAGNLHAAKAKKKATLSAPRAPARSRGGVAHNRAEWVDGGSEDEVGSPYRQWASVVDDD